MSQCVRHRLKYKLVYLCKGKEFAAKYLYLLVQAEKIIKPTTPKNITRKVFDWKIWLINLKNLCGIALTHLLNYGN